MDKVWDKEFYDNVDDAFKRWQVMKELSKECHLIKNYSSNVFLVVWRK